MAEMVSSAVVQEAVNKIVSHVIDKYKGMSSAEQQLERLEMAHIKLAAALEMSEKWHISDATLLRWQKKLKRVAQECDDALRKCRQHPQEQEARNSSSFPKRVAHATKSLISSIFYGNSEEISTINVQRFEWFADSASELLRFVELGGTPRHYTFFHPLITHLLAGKTLKYKSERGNKHHLFFIRPSNVAVAERRTEAKLIFVYRDGSAPEDNFYFSMMLQLSESIDIVGIAIKCLQLFTPHFKPITEAIRRELSQLPTQDFSWVPCVYSCRTEHWDNIHSICTQWFRPKPLCCKQQGQHKSCDNGNIGMPELYDTLEPIIDVYLEHHFLLSGYDKQRTTTQRKRSPKEFSHLKLGVFFMPHGSSEGLLPSVASSVVEVLNGEEKHCLHTDVTLEQLDKIMLPKAIDFLHRDAEATACQMLWKSKHGNAYLNVEKINMQMTTKRRSIRGSKNEVLLQRQDQEKESRTDRVCAFLNVWVVHAPVRIQGPITDWIQKEKAAQLTKSRNGGFWGTTYEPNILGS